VNVFPKFDTNIPFFKNFHILKKICKKKNADLNNVLLGHKCLLCIKAQAYGAITKCQIIEVISSKQFKSSL